jgi:class 3 adenylate cyclase/tetratricopeptide (TPR) repeat protein
MSTQPSEQLAAAIAALEAQRALLGDVVVDTALAPLREKLAALRAPEIAAAAQQLKQVSVLFVDVVGSTAMGQQLDPETIHEVMDSALERFTAVVQAEGGRVLQYTGDGMLAAFGTEVAGEDDVEAAVRAGLAIIEQAKSHAPQVRREHGVPDFNVRVGVHTGRVLLGGGVDAEGSIRGATVNVAARMEQSAPPGRLRISHDSWRHVRGLFEFEEQPAISVKGVEQPMRSYLVASAVPRTQRGGPRGVDGVATRMVGRETELQLLRDGLQRAVAEHGARAITVVGEAGLGKSRLLAEFERSIDRQACWLLLGRAHPRSALQPFGLLRDMLYRQLQIGEGEDPAAARDKLVQALTPLFAEQGEAPMHLLGQLIGLDFTASPHVAELLGDEARFRAQAFEAGALYLRRLGDTRPVVVVVLDDLHWADAGSMEFMRFVLQRDGDVPLLSLTLTRQTMYEEHGDWMRGEPRHTRLDLKPLDHACSGELAEALLRRIRGVPEALRALVIDGAEGNPFYMEELVKMLIDDGVIAVEAEGWRVVDHKLLQVHVPPTLTGVLQARLDALGADEHRAMQQAAIVGHVFWDQALAAIDPAALDCLPLLLQKQLLVQRDAETFADTREYAFKHHLLHQVTYDSVLKAPKRSGHARVGAFWSARAEVAGPQQVDSIKCRALAEAQYHRCQADPQAYVGWFGPQFTHYLDAYAAQTLRPLAEQLVEVCERQFGPEHTETARALTNLARVAQTQGRVDEAEPLLRRAITIQEQSLHADHPDLAQTITTLGGCFSGRGDLHSAEPYFRRALEIRERVLGAEHPLTLFTLDSLAKALVELGRLDEAESLFRRALAAHERSVGTEHSDTAFALTALAEVLGKKGDLAGAEPLIRRALAVQQTSLPPDHPDTGLSMWHLAETLRGLRRSDEAEPLARRTLQVWESSFGPEHEWTAWALISLAETRLAQGAAGEAAELAERAVGVLHKVFGPNHGVLASTLVLQSRAQLADGDDAGEIAAQLERALDILRASDQANSDQAKDAAELLALARQRGGHPG